MAIHSELEKTALDSMEPVWAAQGYKVVRQPLKPDIPEFLGNFRPDAIAIGKDPNLVIEVVNPRNPATGTKLSQLQSLLKDRQGWKLTVVYFGTDEVTVAKTSKSEILEALDKAEGIAEIEPRAALLLAWASLEAIGRRLDGTETGRAVSSRGLTDLLVSLGFASQSQGDELRAFADMRNKIAHGQVNFTPEPQDIHKLVTLARSIHLPN